MHSRRVKGNGSGEIIVQEGSFEDEVDEGVEGVPDEENAETSWGGGREDSKRENECAV